MRVGTLRDQVVIQRQSTTPDAAGQLPDTWTDAFTKFVSLEPLNGREYFQQSGEQARVSTRIRLRYDAETATITPKDRIVDRSLSPEVRYDIDSVIVPRERRMEVILMCRKDIARASSVL